MPLIKGLNRIFILISVISILPVIYLSSDIIKETLRKETDEYKDYLGDIKNQLKNDLIRLSDSEVQKWKEEYDDKQKKLNRPYAGSDFLADSYQNSPRQLYEHVRYYELLSDAPKQYKYPPNYVVIGISFMLGFSEALLLFYILKGVTRLINWVVDGFKEN